MLEKLFSSVTVSVAERQECMQSPTAAAAVSDLFSYPDTAVQNHVTNTRGHLATNPVWGKL